MQTKHLIATDLDGTISFLKNETTATPISFVHDHDMRALKDLQTAGHITVVSTGRDITGIQTFIELSKVTFDYYIAGNGSIITDKDFNILQETAFSQESLFEIIEFLAAHYPRLFITGYDGDKTYLINHRQHHPVFEVPLEKIVYTTIAELKVQQVDFIELDVFPNATTTTEMLKYTRAIEAEIKAHFSTIANIFRNQFYLDFSPLNVSKGTAVLTLAKQLSVPTKQLHTIGDSWNDLSMFEVAGTSYSFPHADAEIQSKVDHVVPFFADMAKKILAK